MSNGDLNIEVASETVKSQLEPEKNGLPQERKVGQTYWSLVKHQYKKNRLAVIAFYVVIFLALMAILADFLANSKPIYAKYNGDIYFPVVKQYLVDLGLTKWPTELLNVEWKSLELESAVWPPVRF